MAGTGGRRGGWRRWFGLALLGAAALVVPGATAGAQGATSTITAVHGVRGLVADVYLDGQLVLPGFQPERSTDPLTVPAGSHRLDVRRAGDPATAIPLVTRTFDAPPGRRISVLVHLAGDGAPQITTYDDDIGPISAGQVRLVLRHGAAAGPVDLLLDGLPLVSALNNPAQFATNQAASPRELTVRVAGQAVPASGPQVVDLQSGTSYTFYLIGSAESSSLGWLVARVDGLGPVPQLMQAGSGGTARAAERGRGRADVLAGALGLLGVAGLVGARLTAPARRRSRGVAPAASAG